MLTCKDVQVISHCWTAQFVLTLTVVVELRSESMVVMYIRKVGF